MKVVIIIPTYNEKDNIEYIYSEITKYSPKDIDLKILFVDDESPDGTAEVIKTLQKKTKIYSLFLVRKTGWGLLMLEGLIMRLKS